MIMTKLTKCKYRIGLTGTLDGTKTHKLVLEGLFGTVNKVVSTSELQEKKQLADLKIFCLILQHDKDARPFLKDKTYQEEMDYLVSNEKEINISGIFVFLYKAILYAYFNMLKNTVRFLKS